MSIGSKPRTQVVLASLMLMLLVAVILLSGYLTPATVGGATAYTGSEYTLDDFPAPFVKEESPGIKTKVLIPSSSPHGPCGAAHTMDTMGGVIIAYTIGVESGKTGVALQLESSMESYSQISTYDTDTARVTMQDYTSNLIAIGGPGVNQVTYYYNELRDEEWNKVLPVLFERDQDGDYLYVQSSGAQYRLEKDGQGRLVADYGVIQIFRDGVRYVLIVYGLGGDASRMAAEIVSDFENWQMTGRAVILKYNDGDADGFLDTVSIVESVEAPEVTIEIFYDSGCTEPVSSIDWGTLEPGDASNTTIYVKNLGETSVLLYLNTQNWDPSEASQHITLDWNYTDSALEPDESIAVELTLTVSPDATDVTDFSFEIVVTGEG